MEDDHRKFCRVSYWKRTDDGAGLVSSSVDEDWTEVVVGPVGSYSCYGEQRFDRAEHAEYRKGGLVYLLRQAFEAGRNDKLREIQKVLS